MALQYLPALKGRNMTAIITPFQGFLVLSAPTQGFTLGCNTVPRWG
jgi:hypothetical protein